MKNLTKQANFWGFLGTNILLCIPVTLVFIFITSFIDAFLIPFRGISLDFDRFISSTVLSFGWLLAIYLTKFVYAKKRIITKDFAKKTSSYYLLYQGGGGIFVIIGILQGSNEFRIPLIIRICITTFASFFLVKRILLHIAEQQNLKG